MRLMEAERVACAASLVKGTLAASAVSVALPLMVEALVCTAPDSAEPMVPAAESTRKSLSTVSASSWVAMSPPRARMVVLPYVLSIIPVISTSWVVSTVMAVAPGSVLSV